MAGRVPASGRASRYVEHVMGMPISLALRGRHAADHRGSAAWAEAMAVLREADRVFSTYRPDSYVSRLGRGELALADCPAEVAEVLELGDRAEADSSGAFSVHRSGADGGAVLDPSGVVKGWAAERAVVALRALADTDFCLSAGGDVVCRTADPEAAPWRIGVEDPHDPQRLVAVVPVHTGAVATSGTAHRGRHLVDARTGRPPSGIASVTVVGNCLTWADIDATAAYAQGQEAARWLGTRPGRAGLVVWADGSTTTVPGAPASAAEETVPAILRIPHTA
jgi:thiamine biosynthesis lipoprotein